MYPSSPRFLSILAAAAVLLAFAVATPAQVEVACVDDPETQCCTDETGENLHMSVGAGAERDLAWLKESFVLLDEHELAATVGLHGFVRDRDDFVVVMDDDPRKPEHVGAE